VLPANPKSASAAGNHIHQNLPERISESRPIPVPACLPKAAGTQIECLTSPVFLHEMEDANPLFYAFGDLSTQSLYLKK
jgi:hypothetical protein